MSTVLARIGAGTDGSSPAPFSMGDCSSLLIELTERRLVYKERANTRQLDPSLLNKSHSTFHSPSFHITEIHSFVDLVLRYTYVSHHTQTNKHARTHARTHTHTVSYIPLPSSPPPSQCWTHGTLGLEFVRRNVHLLEGSRQILLLDAAVARDHPLAALVYIQATN